VTHFAPGKAVVHLGEIGLKLTHQGVQDLSARDLVAFSVLHELAHTNDAHSCSRALAERYGPDLCHIDLEVLSPAAAFSEGWADYQAGHRVSQAQLRLRRFPRAARIEIAKIWPGTGGYRWIMPWELTPSDLLATQEGVTRVLLDLERHLPGGRTTLESAFASRPAGDCQHLGDLLARLPPHSKNQTALEHSLRVAVGTLTTPALAAILLAGKLPRREEATRPPRSRDYQPKPPPKGAPRKWRRLWRRRRRLDRPEANLGIGAGKS
jgi:hypothetical protein